MACPLGMIAASTIVPAEQFESFNSAVTRIALGLAIPLLGPRGSLALRRTSCLAPMETTLSRQR
jgi:hypothetical protein